MNKEYCLKTFPAAFMLVLFLVVPFLGTEGALLCFGKEGHVAVEFVNTCSGSRLGSQLAEMESDACGPCMDIQFLSNPAYTRNVSHYTQSLPLMSLSLMSPSLPPNEYLIKDINPPQFSHHKALASLHSVVLLI